jgi:hypothetical protein
MKRTKRLSIEFLHREVTITVENSTLHFQDGESETADASAVCPACGSPWFTLVAPAEGNIEARVEPIRRALEQSSLHLQVSPAGQLRICQRSFEVLKEKF